MNEANNPISHITTEIRQRMRLTYRAFADALCEHLVNVAISQTSIMNWEKGLYVPSTDFLLICLVVHNDWRAEWAIDCLCAKLPEVFDRAIDHRMIVLTKRVIAWESISRGN
jgi:transcriptional regulator with XRE-family HTH domain